MYALKTVAYAEVIRIHPHDARLKKWLIAQMRKSPGNSFVYKKREKESYLIHEPVR